MVENGNSGRFYFLGFYGFSISHIQTLKLDSKENWAPKNWCLWNVVWRRLLRVPWIARRSNQLILKKINPEYSLDDLMLKVKFQYLATWCEELTHLKRTWRWERLMAGGDGNRCQARSQHLEFSLQYFGHLMRRADSFEKTLMMGKIEGRRRRGW